MPSFTFSPAIISYASATVTAGNTVFPQLPGGPPTIYNFPKANCRQVVILNTGATTIYQGFLWADRWTAVPPPFNPAGIGIAPILGLNCSQIPAGGSFSLELDTFQKRGSFDPQAFTGSQADFVPCMVMFFSAAPATNASALITYVNTNGPF